MAGARDYRGTEMKLLRLLSPCLFGHGDMLRTRDEDGHLALQCVDCGQETRVLTSSAIKGPKHHAVPAKGAPLIAAKRAAVQRRIYPRSA
jgi:hypothetical protein